MIVTDTRTKEIMVARFNKAIGLNNDNQPYDKKYMITLSANDDNLLQYLINENFAVLVLAFTDFEYQAEYVAYHADNLPHGLKFDLIAGYRHMSDAHAMATELNENS